MSRKIGQLERDKNLKIYQAVRKVAVNSAKNLKKPSFYDDFKGELSHSKHLFQKQKIITSCRKLIGITRNSYGHGNYHMRQVALEAGALSLIEAKRQGLSTEQGSRLALLAQISGLLHDIKRKEKNHAQAGAEAAREYLRLLSVKEGDGSYIIIAIRNHEAFKGQIPVKGVEGAIISDSLYDSDKFRWGPDNFTITLWSMLEEGQITPKQLLTHYPEGIEGVARIKDTFRSYTGKEYGPEFIDLGLKIGEEIYKALKLMIPGEN